MDGPPGGVCLGSLALATFIFLAARGAAVAQGAPPPAVTVKPVVSRQITESGDFIGRVVAIDKVDVVARVPGYIEERTFTEGQHVKKGDLLFRIEQSPHPGITNFLDVQPIPTRWWCVRNCPILTAP